MLKSGEVCPENLSSFQSWFNCFRLLHFYINIRSILSISTKFSDRILIQIAISLNITLGKLTVQQYSVLIDEHSSYLFIYVFFNFSQIHFAVLNISVHIFYIFLQVFHIFMLMQILFLLIFPHVCYSYIPVKINFCILIFYPIKLFVYTTRNTNILISAAFVVNIIGFLYR